ncbi:MAG: hypothetical protein RLZZ608_1446, partial [Actinomycetota bacterium]
EIDAAMLASWMAQIASRPGLGGARR